MHLCITGPKTSPPGIGGVEVFSWELARRVAAKELEVTVIAGRLKGQPSVETIGKVEIQRVWSLGNRYLTKLSNMPGVSRALERIGPDVVHANDATSGFVATMGARRQRALVTIHGVGFSASDWPPPFRQGIRFFQQRAVRRAAAVAVTDDATASVLRGLRKDLAIVPPGVDTDVFRRGMYRWPDKLPQGRVNVLYVGRLTRVKGFDLLLDSWARLGPAFRSRATLTVIGGGPMAAMIARSESVNWLGELPHESLPPYFASADVLVQPSRSEGLPISVLEAMASGLPVVSTSVGGLGTVFGDVVTAIDEHTPGGVARALEKAFDDQRETQRKSLVALERVRQGFSWDAVAQKYIEIYERLAG